mgnify:CR=1 FL=1
MRRRSKILSITSGFLILLLLVGSTGAVIVEHTCYSCGLSDLHTEFFSSESQNHGCSCESGPTSSSDKNEKTLEPVCCTFSFEKLSLTEYNNTTLTSYPVVSAPVLSHIYVAQDEQLEKPVFSVLVTNKHGGRDLLRSTCQLLI